MLPLTTPLNKISHDTLFQECVKAVKIPRLYRLLSSREFSHGRARHRGISLSSRNPQRGRRSSVPTSPSHLPRFKRLLLRSSQSMLLAWTRDAPVSSLGRFSSSPSPVSKPCIRSSYGSYRGRWNPGMVDRRLEVVNRHGGIEIRSVLVTTDRESREWLRNSISHGHQLGAKQTNTKRPVMEYRVSSLTLGSRRLIRQRVLALPPDRLSSGASVAESNQEKRKKGKGRNHSSVGEAHVWRKIYTQLKRRASMLRSGIPLKIPETGLVSRLRHSSVPAEITYNPHGLLIALPQTQCDEALRSPRWIEGLKTKTSRLQVATRSIAQLQCRHIPDDICSGGTVIGVCGWTSPSGKV
ncbi:uncharacterized protein F4807DRAFT_299440 [Annulohypoxylon truncatum]|uniref:uncharacterized protein n=1 Tax=Annulohypoxylon truncatum TaxID=327061 RepID=UPI00200771C4|nr:uncharacterized protein F4807DRAFT_299440 [Annulohypoxylon truncatum]KAI1204908.1 hypothetical protein F4807DRAFT_299440 [Annulohypoxylon truncatum]